MSCRYGLIVTPRRRWGGYGAIRHPLPPASLQNHSNQPPQKIWVPKVGSVIPLLYGLNSALLLERGYAEGRRRSHLFNPFDNLRRSCLLKKIWRSTIEPFHHKVGFMHGETSHSLSQTVLKSHGNQSLRKSQSASIKVVRGGVGFRISLQ